MWLLLVAAALLGLVSIPFGIGLATPGELRSTTEKRLEAAPARVWAALAHIERFPMTKARKPAERLGDVGGLPSWREFPAGTGTSLVFETVESVSETRLVRTMKDDVAPVAGRFEIDLVPEGSGTRLVLVERMQIHATGVRGPFFRFAMRMAGGGAGSRAFLERFARDLG